MSVIVRDLNDGKITLTDLHKEFSFRFRSDVVFDGVSQKTTLHTINYNQIDSPKFHPYTIEARGLTIREMRYKNHAVYCVESRSFDRFFNLGEDQAQLNLKDRNIKFMEKLDGSLIRIWYNVFQDKWVVATRGTNFGDAEMPCGKVFLNEVQEYFIEKTGISLDHYLTKLNVDPNITLICEWTSPDNRIVTPYKENRLYLLAARETSGKYVDATHVVDNDVIFSPKRFEFEFGVSEALDTVEDLLDLEEGFVGYDGDTGEPLFKIKSETYVRIHHLRGSLNPTWKQWTKLFLEGESSEYLTYYPEDDHKFKTVKETEKTIKRLADALYNDVLYWTGSPSSKKEFALELVKRKSPFQAILFTAYDRGIKPSEVYSTVLDNDQRMKLLVPLLEKEDESY